MNCQTQKYIEKIETGRPKHRELHELQYTEIDREKEKRQGDQNRKIYMNCLTQKLWNPVILNSPQDCSVDMKVRGNLFGEIFGLKMSWNVFKFRQKKFCFVSNMAKLVWERKISLIMFTIIRTKLWVHFTPSFLIQWSLRSKIFFSKRQAFCVIQICRTPWICNLQSTVRLD